MRLLMSATLILLGVSTSVGCRMCDSCYPHGPVVNGAACATCGTQGAGQPYYSQGATTTVQPEMVPVGQ